MGKTYFTYPPITDYGLQINNILVNPTSGNTLEGDYAHTPVTWTSAGKPHFGFDVNKTDDQFTLVVGGWVGINYVDGVNLSSLSSLKDRVALAVNGRVLVVENTAEPSQPLLEVQGDLTVRKKILTPGKPKPFRIVDSLTVDSSTRQATFHGNVDILSELWVKGKVYLGGETKPDIPFDPNQKPNVNHYPQVLSVTDGFITIANQITSTPAAPGVSATAAARGVVRLGQQGIETHYRDKQYRWFGLTLAWFNNAGATAPNTDDTAALRASFQMIDGRDAALTWGPSQTSKLRLRFIWTKFGKKSKLGLVRAVDNREVTGAPKRAHDAEAKRTKKARTGQVVHRDIVTVSPKGEVRVMGTVHSLGYREDSDVRAKESIEPLSGALAKVLRLRGVSYRWKRKVSSDRSRHIGFVAQEVEELCPEVVSTDEDGRKSVDYTRLIPVLIEAVKEQQKLIDAQSEQISKLEAMIRRLGSS